MHTINSCKILHWNVWSLTNASKLILYLQILTDMNIDIALINETWFDSEAGLFSKRIKETGYNLYHDYRTSKRGGGVAILYRNNLSIKEREASVTKYESFEFVSILLRLKSTENILLISVYRKQEIPYSVFQDEWNVFLDNYIDKNVSLLVVGDLNLWVDITEDKESKCFLSLMNAYGLDQVVTGPTHRCGHTLDQIYVNQYQVNLSYTVVNDFLGVCSDHSPILIDIPRASNTNTTKSSFCRNIKSIDLENFQADVLQMCNSIDTESTFSELVSQYVEKSEVVMNNHAPLKRVKQKKTSPKWMDSEYMKSRALRRKLEKKWKIDPSETNRHNYIKQKNICCALSLKKQKAYYSNLVSSSNSQKDLFKVAKNLMDKTKDKILPPHSDTTLLANQFNDFFVEKVEKIRKSIPVKQEDMSPYSRNFVGTRLSSFRLMTIGEVRDIIKEFGIKTSQEDPIPAALLSSSLEIVLPLITEIVNKSLAEGCMDGIKESIIMPLLKKSGLDAEVFKNFRPVNTLLFFSKLIERVVLIQLNEHMTKHNLHELSQYGYKKFHSTELMILGLVDEVLRGFDVNLVTLIVFLDLSAAFDTLDIDKLLEILHNEIGIDGVALEWFRAFLTKRTQKVKIDGSFSEQREVPCGVPQGSVLGPVLFNINVRSQPLVFQNCSFSTSSFADDSNGRKQFSLSFQFHVLTKDIVSCIEKIVCWSNAHFVKINPDKTEFLLLRPSSLNKQVIIQGVFIDGQCIRFSDKVKNVGVILDQNLNLNNQVNKVVSHCYALMRDVRRIKQYLSKKDLERIINAIVSHRLYYCNSIYVGISKKNLHKLQRCQKAAARLIADKSKRDNINILEVVHWMSIEAGIVYKIILFVFKILNGQCSNSFNITYKNNSLRSGSGLLLNTPNFKTKYGVRIFEYSSTRYWNALPDNIKTINCIEKFKKELKMLLLHNFDELKRKAFMYITL